MAAKKILVIEDDRGILENISDLLEAEDFVVIAATDGYKGISLATTEQPNLILCDRMMRNGNGNQVLAAIRDNPVTAQIPFIFLTAMAAKQDVREGMVAGADDYLTKPFNRADLMSTIYAQLEKAKSRALDTKSKMAVVSESIRTHLQHIYGNLELYREEHPTALENEEFADAWNSTLLAIAKIDKVIAAMVPKQ